MKKILIATIALIGALTVAFIVGASRANKAGLWGAEAAAWAQAGGTMAALLVAVFVGQLSVEADDRRRRQAAADLVNAINDSVDLALNAAYDIRVAIRTPNVPAFVNALKEYDDHAAFPVGKMLAMPLERWPSPIFYMRVLALNSTLASLVGIAKTVGPYMSEGSIGEWNSLKASEGKVGDAEVAYNQSREGLKLG